MFSYYRMCSLTIERDVLELRCVLCARLCISCPALLGLFSCGCRSLLAVFFYKNKNIYIKKRKKDFSCGCRSLLAVLRICTIYIYYMYYIYVYYVYYIYIYIYILKIYCRSLLAVLRTWRSLFFFSVLRSCRSLFFFLAVVGLF